MAAKVIPIHKLLSSQDKDKLAARLERNIARQANGCIEWKGASNNDGYRKMNFRHRGKHVQVYVHRVLWVLANNKEAPSHLVIDHECENRACCNPAHLRLRTQKTNVQMIYSRRKAQA
jgi:hypothetical protein